MLCRLEYGRVSRDSRSRVDQLPRTQAGTAFFALVTVSIGIAAIGTSANDISICEEDAFLLIIILIGSFLQEQLLVVNVGKEVLRRLMMRFVTGAAIDAEGDAKVFKRLLHHIMIFVDEFSRGNAGLFGAQGNGDTVFIRAADKHDVLALEP